MPKSTKGAKVTGSMQHAYLYANLVYTVNESFSAATIIVAKGV